MNSTKSRGARDRRIFEGAMPNQPKPSMNSSVAEKTRKLLLLLLLPCYHLQAVPIETVLTTSLQSYFLELASKLHSALALIPPARVT